MSTSNDSKIQSCFDPVMSHTTSFTDTAHTKANLSSPPLEFEVQVHLESKCRSVITDCWIWVMWEKRMWLITGSWGRERKNLKVWLWFDMWSTIRGPNVGHNKSPFYWYCGLNWISCMLCHWPILTCPSAFIGDLYWHFVVEHTAKPSVLGYYHLRHLCF